MDLITIRQAIDNDGSPDDIRAALGEKIMECLIERGEQLDAWERVNFGAAIDLLPSPWLRLTWTHVDSVCNRYENQPSGKSPFTAGAPSVQELFNKLIEILAAIHQRQQVIAMAKGEAGV